MTTVHPDAPTEHGPGPPPVAKRPTALPLRPRRPLGSISQALAHAEQAAGSTPARIERTQRLLTSINDLPAALATDPRVFAATAAGLRRQFASLLSGITHPDARRLPGPHADDWRALCARFAPTGIALGHVRPRTYQQYAADEAPLPSGHHPSARPAGLFALHLSNCAPCLDAHAAGRIHPGCEIHVMCALAEGVWPVYSHDGPPPEPQRPAPLPLHATTSLPPEDVQWAAATFEGMVTRGIGEWLTPAQAADPLQCAAVAPIWVVRVHRRPAADAFEGCTDIPSIALAAQRDGHAEADAYLDAAAGATPHDPAGRARLTAAWNSSRADKVTVVKRRLIEQLQLTVNPHTEHMGVTFPLATDTLSESSATDILTADDAVEAYRAMPVRPALARHMCTLCPATGRVFRPSRLPFGFTQSCSAYCAFTGVIKEFLRGPPSTPTGGPTLESLRGALDTVPDLSFLRDVPDEVILCMAAGHGVVTGVVDDIFGRHPARLHTPISALRTHAYAAAGYLPSAKKHRHGPSVVLLGLTCTIPCNSAPASVAIQPTKLYQVLHDVAVWTRIGARRPRDGYGPTSALEALVGDLQWLAGTDSGTALRIHGVRAAHLIAATKSRLFAVAGRASPCHAPLAAILDRALRGLLRPTAVIPHRSAITSFAIRTESGLHGLQARAIPHPGGPVSVTSATDASLEAGVVRWGSVTTNSSGTSRTAAGSRPARRGESSTSAELEACAAFAQEHFCAHPGTIVVMLLDSLAATFCILKARANYGSPAFSSLERLLTLAELHNIEVLPIWVPRTANTTADALTHPSPAGAERLRLDTSSDTR